MKKDITEVTIVILQELLNFLIGLIYIVIRRVLLKIGKKLNLQEKWKIESGKLKFDKFY